MNKINFSEISIRVSIALAVITGASFMLMADFHQSGDAAAVYSLLNMAAGVARIFDVPVPSLWMLTGLFILAPSLAVYFLLRPSSVLRAFVLGAAGMAVVTTLTPSRIDNRVEKEMSALTQPLPNFTRLS